MKFILTVIFTPDSSIIIRTVTLGTPTIELLRAQSASPPPFCDTLSGEPGEVREPNFIAWYLALRFCHLHASPLYTYMSVPVQQSPAYLHKHCKADAR
jgi:hypothetical protein